VTGAPLATRLRTASYHVRDGASRSLQASTPLDVGCAQWYTVTVNMHSPCGRPRYILCSASRRLLLHCDILRSHHSLCMTVAPAANREGGFPSDNKSSPGNMRVFERAFGNRQPRVIHPLRHSGILRHPIVILHLAYSIHSHKSSMFPD
jgi:hypothetical protein